MAIFTAKDIFEIAVKIEENGEAFYRDTASNMSDSKIKKLFLELADEEVKHKHIFQRLAGQLGSVKLPLQSNQEYTAYLEAYTQHLIFSGGETDSKLANISDEKVALLYAIDKELDTVHYYKEVKSLIPESDHALIDKIIAEERTHVIRLAEIKKKLK
jgi:rubrerythrin